MELIIIFILAVASLIIGAIMAGWWTTRHQQQNMKDLVAQVFGESASLLAKQSAQLLSGERQLISTQLQEKQQAFNDSIKLLHDALRDQRKAVNALESTQQQTFGTLTEQLKQQRQITDQLNLSTTQLNLVLASNQQRGGWGERILEDILEQNGLMEGTHFVRQKFLGKSELKPDVTLRLPNDRVVPVDVKFPLAALQKMTAASGEKEKTLAANQFRSDLKEKINQVEKYIRPDLGTFEYALLFVPNESVFSFINQKFGEIIDEAMARRVLLVSPFSFLVVARTILEGYRAFQFGEKLRFVLSHLSAFEKEWDQFSVSFLKFGATIDSMQKTYDSITSTRYKALQKRTGKLKETLTLAIAKNEKAALPEETE